MIEPEGGTVRIKGVEYRLTVFHNQWGTSYVLHNLAHKTSLYFNDREELARVLNNR